MSPLWAPYKIGDIITVVPAREMLGSWDRLYTAASPSIVAAPVVVVDLMDSNVDGRQRVSGGGNKGPKGEKGQKGKKGPKGDKGQKGPKVKESEQNRLPKVRHIRDGHALGK